MSFFNRLSASLNAFARDERAQANVFFWVSIGLGMTGGPAIAAWGFSFTACLYLRSLCGKATDGQ